MPSQPTAVLAVLLTFVIACDAVDSDGIRDADELLPLRLEEELRIGSVDDPNVGFSRIGGVAVDRDGLVYVAETQDLQIRVYDADGRAVRTIGRAGNGPGEFRSLSMLGLIGDTLWATDRDLGRLTLMRRSGEVFREITIPRLQLEPVPGVMLLIIPGALRGDGTIGSTSAMAATTREAPADSFSIPYVRFDTTGGVLDTLRAERWAFPRRNTINVGGREIGVPTPSASYRLRLFAGDDAFVVERPVAAAPEDARFTVTHVTAAGDTSFRREFRYRPRSFDAIVVDTLIHRSTTFLARQADLDIDAVRVALRRAIELPAYQPPISSGRVGEDGVLWLQREDDGLPVRRWLFIEPDGSPRGATELPRTADVRWSRGGVVWASVRDDFDVPWLVRYRLVGDP